MFFQFYYDNLFILYKYSTILGLYLVCGRLVRRFLSNGRDRHRRSNFTPFKLRVKAYLNETFLGKLNLYSYVIYERLRNKYFSNFIYKSIFKNTFFYRSHSLKAIPLFFTSTVLIHEWGVKQGRPLIVRTAFDAPNDDSDMVIMLFSHAKNPNLPSIIVENEIKLKNTMLEASKSFPHIDYKENSQVNLIDNYELAYNKELIVSDLDFAQYGKLFSSVFQEEIAYQCYYIAYLKNRKVGCNSYLKFSTKI